MGAQQLTDFPTPETLPSWDLPPDVSLEWSGLEVKAKILGTENFYRLYPNPSSKLTADAAIRLQKKKKKKDESFPTTLSCWVGEKDVIAEDLPPLPPPNSVPLYSAGSEKTKTKRCHICGKGFYKLTYLKRHVLSHSNAKPLKCDVCGWGFFQKENLDNHMKTHESDTVQETKEDSSPKRPTNNEDSTNAVSEEAVANKSPEEKSSVTKWICKVCGKNFVKRENYQNHITLHRNSKTFSCSVCNRRFSDEFICRKHTQLRHPKAVESQD